MSNVVFRYQDGPPLVELRTGNNDHSMVACNSLLHNYRYAAVATIQQYLRGKILYGVVRVGEIFLRRHAKSPVSAPPIEVNSCTKIY